MHLHVCYNTVYEARASPWLAFLCIKATEETTDGFSLIIKSSGLTEPLI